MKVDMKSTDYYKSGRHKENVLAAGLKAIASNRQKRLERVTNYNKNPNKCEQCNLLVDYKKKTNKFCSSSCAATYNNTRKFPRSEASKLKTSNALKGIKRPNSWIGRFCKVELATCSQCDNSYYVNSIKWGRTTCSRKCATIASTRCRTYQNGSRKAEWFYNSYENKDVLLESSWEKRTAERLIKLDIHWVRPVPLDWIDEKGKQRLYYPDFYLKDFNLYLDPKNPYCMALDEYKMKTVSENINIIFGDINMILDHIDQIKELSGLRLIGKAPVLDTGARGS